MSDRILLPIFLRLPSPPLALRNVLHGRFRSVAAVAGISFALTMVLLQLGFFGAVKITATTIYNQLDFDIIILSPEYAQLFDAGTIPSERLRQAESLDEVGSVSPLHVVMNLWRCPPYPPREREAGVPAAGTTAETARRRASSASRSLQLRELLMIGIDLDRNPFLEPIRSDVEAAKPLLRLEHRLLMNEWSNPDFGWQNRAENTEWELGRHSVEVVGGFPMLRGFGADGAVLCSDENFVTFAPWRSRQHVSAGLVRLSTGKPEEVVKRLQATLPADVMVLSRRQLLERETRHWVSNTATGEIFGFGVLVAIIVAAVVIYQVLSNDVRRHLAEYATLKAMGHSTFFLSRSVVTQGMIYSLFSYALALTIGFPLYQLTEAIASIPMRLTLANALIALLLTVAVGLGSSMLTLRRLATAEPADLYS